MRSIWLYRIPLALTTMCMISAASAQYIWLDEKGSKQYSDMPPGPSVPKNRILKEPSVTRTQAPAPAVANADSTEKAASVPMTLSEQKAAFKKRQMEQAEKDKKANDETKRQADQAKNCERARAYNQSLVSGARISRTDSNGERVYLTDEQRTQEEKETGSILEKCK